MAEFTDVGGVVTIRDKNGKPRLIIGSDGSLLTRDSNNDANGSISGGGSSSGGTATFARAGVVITSTGTQRFTFNSAATISSVRISAGTAPTGSSIIVDVNKNGTTIFTTQANRPSIAISGNASSSATPDVTAISAGDYLTVDVDQAGSTIPGSDLTVQVYYS